MSQAEQHSAQSSSQSQVLAAERERLRRESREGACPTCGRTENVELERQIQSYAQANSRLHVELSAVRGSNMSNHMDGQRVWVAIGSHVINDPAFDIVGVFTSREKALAAAQAVFGNESVDAQEYAVDREEGWDMAEIER